MFSRQKIATVSGLIGSLAVICVGATQAHAEQPKPKGECKTSTAGETTCIHKSETVHIDRKNGSYSIKQTQECSTTDRPYVVKPGDAKLNQGNLKVGPTVDCSNNTKLPKGFRVPHFEF
uniref:Secreted protein n=1 Tax=Streptomyces sp. NBC_00003 TaxID=2903608 RepID=A0AAU2V8U0_9ACTN